MALDNVLGDVMASPGVVTTAAVLCAYAAALFRTQKPARWYLSSLTAGAWNTLIMHHRGMFSRIFDILKHRITFALFLSSFDAWRRRAALPYLLHISLNVRRW